jgi:ferric-dicitrate binding protein FerR (iron transport regulator)
MTEFNDNDLAFVVRRYRPDKYDTRKALGRFHEQTATPVYRRWWLTAAAAAASIVLVFAAGYGIHSWIRSEANPSAQEQPALQQAPSQFFVFEEAPVDQVLQQLSDYYHCTLTAPPTEKRLTATFSSEDGLAVIVPLIEAALDVKITVE